MGAPGTGHLPVQNRELMPQHRDLDVLRIWGRTEPGKTQHPLQDHSPKGSRHHGRDHDSRRIAPGTGLTLKWHPSGGRHLLLLAAGLLGLGKIAAGDALDILWIIRRCG